MFTGIIETTGVIERLVPTGGDSALVIKAPRLGFDDVSLGDSIAVSGVCLTVTRLLEQGFQADVSNETLSRTSLGSLRQGDLVNLEKALRVSSRLGGHLVSGHVDGLAALLSRTADGRSERLLFRAPRALARYIAPKGSVCLDGVSLTVNEVADDTFAVNIIPHTAERTTIHLYRPGRQVNLEVDIISRYLERLLTGPDGPAAQAGGLTETFLTQHGFVGTSSKP